MRSPRIENKPAMRWAPTSLRDAITATRSALAAAPPHRVMRHKLRMVNAALAGRLGAGTGLTAGLLAAMPPLRTMLGSRIRGRIIVEN